MLSSFEIHSDLPASPLTPLNPVYINSRQSVFIVKHHLLLLKSLPQLPHCPADTVTSLHCPPGSHGLALFHLSPEWVTLLTAQAPLTAFPLGLSE